MTAPSFVSSRPLCGPRFYMCDSIITGQTYVLFSISAMPCGNVLSGRCNHMLIVCLSLGNMLQRSIRYMFRYKGKYHTDQLLRDRLPCYEPASTFSLPPDKVSQPNLSIRMSLGRRSSHLVKHRPKLLTPQQTRWSSILLDERLVP